jgi:chemotaxis regulatin CheY-phosphate phosphatase CheZ
MEENTKLPVIHLELTTGVFKIKAEDAIYEIEVKADSSLTQVVEKIVEKEVVVEKDAKKELESPKEAAEEGVSDQFYKEISEEMFNEIGKMARDLSISIKTPLEDDMKNVDISQAGVDLESAKGKLQNIVEMTEKATMEIMDISENIQEGCDEIKKHLTEIQKIEFIGRLEKEGHEEAPAESNNEILVEDIDAVIDREEKLKQELLNLPLQPAAEEAKEPVPEPVPEPVAEPETKTVKVYSFNIDVVFQTLYELCTNEQVKLHIKAMRGEVDNAFAIDNVLKDFSKMAPTVDVEDNFFNFSLPDILKILFQHSKEEKYSKTLKKMHQSAASIFLDQILPIEGSVEEKEVQSEKKAEEPKENNASAATPDNPLTGIIKLIDENIEKLKAHRDKLSNMPVVSSTASSEQNLHKKDQKKLIDAIESTDKLIKTIIFNISRILESLSFQDLSGQQIKKILSVLSSVQVQLLSMLVTFGVKLKKKDEYESLAVGEKEDLVHQEVDKMKSKVADDVWEDEAEGERGGPLNQDAVDDLLAELGF